jgi:succinate dehydrogenase/fumarate reductase flavoprotein subunit
LVIGQGVAGCCAALEAHRAGSDVLIVERASGGGGASAVSSGIYYLGGGTAVQEALGHEDSPDEMTVYIMASCDPLDPLAQLIKRIIVNKRAGRHAAGANWAG